MTNNIKDIHEQPLTHSCLLTLKKELYTLNMADPNQPLIYEIEGFKMLRSFNKSEHKIVLIEIESAAHGLNLFYETEGAEFQLYLKVTAKLST